MIQVIELISGQSFESKKLAAEYFNIPITVVNASIKSGLKLELDNKEYKFENRKGIMDQVTAVVPPPKRFPFGKYKDQIIRKCMDLSYMKWLLEQNINDRLRFAIRTRVNELKGETEI